MSEEADKNLADAAGRADLQAALAALRAGGDPDAAGPFGLRPLHRVAAAGAGGADAGVCLAIQAALHRAGANPSLRDDSHRVASHYWPSEAFRAANLAQALYVKGDLAALRSLRVGGKALRDWLPDGEIPARGPARPIDGGRSL